MDIEPRPHYKSGFHLDPTFASQMSSGKVGVIMGSQSDWPFVHPCTDMLEQLKIPFEFGVVSAHRTAERMMQYAHTAAKRGLQVIIACAGGSAHLPGMIASEVLLPTFGITPKKDDLHAVGSMIAMPEGKPLGYMGGGSGPGKNAGAVNAALMAARILALNNNRIRARLSEYDRKLREGVPFTVY